MMELSGKNMTMSSNVASNKSMALVVADENIEMHIGMLRILKKDFDIIKERLGKLNCFIFGKIYRVK